jgi:hypothetical protein
MALPESLVLMVIVLAATACAGLGDPSGPVAGPTSGPSPASSPVGTSPFVPTPEVTGDQARLSLTFPDGTEALIGYPSHLELPQMGVQPDVDLTWKDRWVGAIVFSRHGPMEELLERRVALHPADPPVEEWTARDRGGRHQLTTEWLVFRLPSWTVHVPMDGLLEADDLLGRVRPYETDPGFVAVDLTEPAELADGFGEAGGPQLSFGDGVPLPDFVDPNQNGLLIEVAPTNCRGFTIEVHGSYGSACLGDGSFFVNATDFSDESRQKLREIVEELRVLRLEPAN